VKSPGRSHPAEGTQDGCSRRRWRVSLRLKGSFSPSLNGLIRATTGGVGFADRMRPTIIDSAIGKSREIVLIRCSPAAANRKSYRPVHCATTFDFRMPGQRAGQAVRNRERTRPGYLRDTQRPLTRALVSNESEPARGMSQSAPPVPSRQNLPGVAPVTTIRDEHWPASSPHMARRSAWALSPASKLGLRKKGHSLLFVRAVAAADGRRIHLACEHSDRQIHTVHGTGGPAWRGPSTSGLVS